MCTAASPVWERTLPHAPKGMCCSRCAPPCPTAPSTCGSPSPHCHLRRHWALPFGAQQGTRRRTCPAKKSERVCPGDVGSLGVGELGAQLTGWSREGQCREQQEIWAHTAKAAAGLKASQADGKARNKEEATGTVKGGRRGHGRAPRDRRAGSICTLGTSCCVPSLPPALKPQSLLQGFLPAASCSMGMDDGTSAYITQ